MGFKGNPKKPEEPTWDSKETRGNPKKPKETQRNPRKPEETLGNTRGQREEIEGG